jgi:hypothetical protein
MSESGRMSSEHGGAHASTIVPLQIWDTPANFDLDQLDVPLASFSTLVYVIDMQVRMLSMLPILPTLATSQAPTSRANGSKTTRITRPCGRQSP